MAFKLGMGQMLVVGGVPEQNLARAATMIGQAADEGCRLVILPECLNLGWTHSSARQLAQPIPGPHADVLCAAARQAGLFVAAGLVERDGERLYNSAVLIGPDGAILRRHRKINELDIAHHLYSCGDSLAVVPTELGVIGLNICADNAPGSLSLGHALCRMGAQLIVSPSAWAVPPGYDNGKQPYGQMWLESYTALAKLYDVTVIGVSNVGAISDGPWQGWDCIGCSLAVGPEGAILGKGPYGPDAQAMLVIEVEARERTAWGTTLRAQLSRRGYQGP
jgi:predicted amidohydrolase